MLSGMFYGNQEEAVGLRREEKKSRMPSETCEKRKKEARQDGDKQWRYIAWPERKQARDSMT